jgi:hypothetical protein
MRTGHPQRRSAGPAASAARWRMRPGGYGPLSGKKAAAAAAAAAKGGGALGAGSVFTQRRAGADAEPGAAAAVDSRWSWRISWRISG